MSWSHWLASKARIDASEILRRAINHLLDERSVSWVHCNLPLRFLLLVNNQAHEDDSRRLLLLFKGHKVSIDILTSEEILQVKVNYKLKLPWVLIEEKFQVKLGENLRWCGKEGSRRRWSAHQSSIFSGLSAVNRWLRELKRIMITWIKCIMI